MHVLLRPRWIAAHLVVAAACVVFSQLGLWQLRRLDDRRARNAVAAQRAALPVAELGDALDGGDAAHRRVVVRGRFDTSNEVLLRSRAWKGRPGFGVLTPLVTGDGTAVLVDRGWVPFEFDDPPVDAAAPPADDVEVTGVLVATQQRTRFGPKDPPGRLDTVGIVDVPRLDGQVPYDLAPLYLRLQDQSPPAGDLPVPPEAPAAGDGPHLSYAVQWFAFIPTALIVYAAWTRSWLRRTARRSATATGAAASPAQPAAS